MMAGVTIGFAVWGSVRTQPVHTAAWAVERSREVREVAGVPQDAPKVQDTLKLHALSAVLIDGDSGRILYGKDAHTVRPMASTTKIMTCILALENGSLSDVCTVSAQAAAQPKVHLGAPEGSHFYLKDLLYSLMLESHNDTAVVIAEQIAGSVEAFAELMNQKARDIGCQETYFITPNGLDATKTTEAGETLAHSTSAADLAAIMRYCVMESPVRDEFLEITRTGNYSFTDQEGKRTYSCVNHNALLNMMEGALSGKTGFTGGAGYSYVAAWREGERTLVAALLGSGWPPHKTYKWSDVRTLFGYGKEHFAYREVPFQTEFPNISVRDGIEADAVAVTLGLPDKEARMNLLLSEAETIEQRAELPAELEAPVRKGDVVGYLVCSLNGAVIRSCPIQSAATIRRWDFRYCAETVYREFFAIRN